MEELGPQERGLVLRFVTSSSRAPLGGFRFLQPPLTIHKVDCGSDASVLALLGGKDVDRLPSASTCYNMLKLPNYKRKDTLRKKLVFAVSSGAGFELS
ncbi:E3 ubiquitin-protein ligase [Haematococcus lacustris]|uniref:HECT-type E3 ubiquitin transferase n=1 Tax=Haematococcus lacustris TaxID=44745 RepID=A0A699YW02_HAELA|nr:E3 ubiquitin-protein ligase [Haematococcus lacustris]